MNEKITPILKWAGGKRQLIDKIMPLIPVDYETYYEPFIGAGAVLLALKPHNAVINDSNWEIINVYKTIRDHVEELLELLEEHSVNHTPEYYYQIRKIDRETNYLDNHSIIEMAARTIYLNKTCFNGLFRVNSKGFFNTPIGHYKNPNIVNSENIMKLHQYLNEENIQLLTGDYESALDGIGEKDFVYFDPPYDPLSKTSSFTSYTKENFDIEEQKRLKKVCDRLTRNNIRFMLSNSDTEMLRELYCEYKIIAIPSKRMINAKGNGRNSIDELLITNY